MSQVIPHPPVRPRSGASAFLFCDLVGSTALLSRIGEEANNDVRRDMFAAMRRPIEAVGGIDRPEFGAGTPTAPGYSADGDTLAIGTTGAVAVYDARRGAPTATVLRGQRAAVSQVDFTETGLVVVASVDDTVRMFDPSGAPLGDSLGVATLSSPIVGGSAVAITDPGGRLLVVELDASRWPAIAAAWAGRTLTEAERQQFGLGP